MATGFQFERTHDMDVVRRIITHPQVYPYITDDGCPPADQFVPVDAPALWYLLVRRGEEILGLFLLHPLNSTCYEVHTCLLPSCWGPDAVEVAREARQWVWENMPAKRVVTNVPENNPLALRFALKAGFRAYGTNPASIEVGGRLYAQHLLGVSKEGG